MALKVSNEKSARECGIYFTASIRDSFVCLFIPYMNEGASFVCLFTHNEFSGSASSGISIKNQGLRVFLSFEMDLTVCL